MGSLRFFRYLRAGPVLMCLLSTLHGLDPNRPTSQYIRQQWDAENGLSGGPVHAISQTADGYLWIGTDKGLTRFDGLGFQSVPLSAPAPTSNVPVLGLTTDDHGNLVILPQGPGVLRLKDGRVESIDTGARAASRVTAMRKYLDGSVLMTDQEAGAIRFRNEKVEVLATADKLPPVISLAVAPDGNIWLGTLNGNLYSLSGGRLTSTETGLRYQKINCLLVVSNNELWVGTDNGVLRWDGASFAKVALPQSVSDTQVLTMLRDRDANIWLGTARGLLRVNANGMSVFEGQDFLGGEGAVNALFEDREGNIWVGGARLERIRDSAFVTYSTATGLPSEHTGPVFVDSQNRTWFAPIEGGLDVLKDGKVEEIKAAGLTKDVVYSIAGTDDGTLWIGRQHGGLTRLQSGRGTEDLQTYTQTDGLAQNSIYSLCVDRDGAVWAGTLSAGVNRLKDGQFVTYTAANGLGSNTISSILQTSDGAIWFGTSGGLSVLASGRWRTYTTRDGLPSDYINSLYQDSSGALWIGTSAGLAFSSSGKIKAVSVVHPSLGAEIFGVVEDRNGDLWLATSGHILRAPTHRLVSPALESSDLREYGLADGLLSVEGVKRNGSVVRDSSGNIWFSMNRGLSVVNPSYRAGSAAPALPHIESIMADGKAADSKDSVRIPGSSRRITIRFTGLSLTIPDRVRFRYTLDKFDRVWSEPVSAREAVYTNLGPGTYRFRLIASNSDGLWNGPEAVFPFEVEPTWWQTWWFRLSVIAFVGFVALAFYRMRLHQHAHQLNVLFEERLAERTRIAQDLHDTLLQGVLSASMQLHVANDQLAAASPAKPIVGRVLELMAQVIDDGRHALRGLRVPADVANLEQAFSKVPHDLSVQNGVDFRLMVEGQVRPLHPVIYDEVYRIGREALANAFRHSQATGVEVELEYGNSQLRVLIRDNGCGIDPQVLRTGREGHFGLSGMRERAERVGARLKLWSRLDGGTEVELSVPSHVAYRHYVASREWRWLKRSNGRQKKH